MRIAILPVEKESYQKNNGFVSSTNIAYIMSFLEINFPEELIFPIAELDLIYKSVPDVICVYVQYSEAFNKAVEIINSLRETISVPIIMLGNHITYLPKTLPESVNLGILGEGENTLKQVIELIKNNNLNERVLAKIPGIVFHSKSQKIVTEKAKFIQDIDSLPLTRRFFYKMPGNWLPSITTGRGNPSKNIFSNSDIPLRLHSAERIVGDIVDIMTFYPETKIVPVMDYLFLHDINRFKRFIEIVEETNLTKYIRLEINAKAYQLTEDIIYLLRYVLDTPKLNIDFGSPSEKNQKELKETLMSSEHHIKILEACYRFNINTELRFSIGTPNETKEEVAKNYWIIRNNYIRKYRDFSCKAELVLPVPGTESWQKALIKKIINESFDFDNLNSNNINQKTPILSNTSYEDINKIIEEYNNININEKHSIYIEEVITKKTEENVEKDANNLIEQVMKEVVINEELFRDYVHKKPIVNDYDKKENLTVTEIIEHYMISNEDPYSLMDSIYKASNRYFKKSGNIISYDKEMLGILTIPTIEQLAKSPDANKILQISDPLAFDLKRIFIDNKLEIDTLLPNAFNKINFKLQQEKKYDTIVLFFTLDVVLNPDKLLKYCRSILTDNGTLIISFFNVKSLYLIKNLVNNVDIDNFFYGLKRNNMFSMDSMTKLISKNDFILTNIQPVEFPDKYNVSYIHRITTGAFRKFYGNSNDYYDLSYTFVCKKK